MLKTIASWWRHAWRGDDAHRAEMEYRQEVELTEQAIEETREQVEIARRLKEARDTLERKISDD